MYDEGLAQRVREVFQQKEIFVKEKRMMGGLCFMLNDKMCCGVCFNKKKNADLLMIRIGEESFNKEIDKDCCISMDFTGKPMKGFLFVTEDGFVEDKDLEHWIQLTVDFNPEAKRSKKKN